MCVVLPAVAPKPWTNAKVGRLASTPLYAIVSEDFVGKAGSMILRLSAPRLPPPATTEMARSAMMVQEMPPAAAASAARATVAQHRGRFHLLEMPVEPPVDLVVGSRYNTAKRLLVSVVVVIVPQQLL